MSGAPRRPGAGVAALVDRRPLLVVAAVGLLVAVLQVLWIWRLRPLGAFDTDEAGYLATALRMERTAPDGLLWSTSTTTTAGPFVPLLSAAAMSLGSRSVQWAMVVQPLLQATTAVGAAGLTRSMASARHAVAAGLLVLTIPGMVHAGRSYQLVLGATATLTLALWALSRSDRGARLWPMLAFGASVGAMTLTRTMTVAFLPALAVATLIQIRPTRRAIRNLGLAAIVALVLGAPWWIAAWDRASRYLVRYGYGDLSTSYADTDWWARPSRLLEQTRADLGPVLFVLAAVLTTLVALRLARSSTSRPGARLRNLSSVDRTRASVAGLLVVAGITLCTSANAGLWFELPLVVVAVSLAVGCTPLLRRTVRRALGAATLVVLALNFLPIIGTNDGQGPFTALDPIAVGLVGQSHPPAPGLVDADERLQGARHSEAALEWWTAHLELVRALETTLADVPVPRAATLGSSALANHNTLVLTEELTGLGADDTRPFDPTADDPAELEDYDAVVVFESSAPSFPADRDAASAVRELLDTGWSRTSEVDLPAGGTASVLVPPLR